MSLNAGAIWRGLGGEQGPKVRDALLYTAFTTAAFFTLKPARDAQFLSQIGAHRLPYLYMALGIFLAGAASGIARLLKGMPMGRAVNRLTAAAIAVNLVFWGAAKAGPGPWFYWAFYFWVTLMGFTLALYGWLLCNELFTVREARRSFWLIGLGATLGAFLGGLLAGLSVSLFGTNSLFLLAVFQLICGLFVMKHAEFRFPDLWKYQSSALLKIPPRQSMFQILRGSRYLLWIMAALFLMEFASTWIEFLFQSGVQARIASATGMARFFSWFYAGTNLLQMLVQVFLSRALLQGAGLRWTLPMLPLALGLFSIGLPMADGMILLLLLRGCDSLLRQTVTRTSLELLYLPIPTEVKQSIRGPLEALFQRSGMALAGSGVLLLTYVARRTNLGLYIPLWGALFLLTIVSARLYLRYLEALKSSFKLPPGLPKELEPSAADPDLKEKLTQALRSPDEPTVLNALEFVEALDRQDVLWPSFVNHPSAQVRLKTLQLSSYWGSQAIRNLVSPLLADPVAEVRAEAVHLACSLGGDEASRLVAPHLHSSDPAVRAQAAACLAKGKGPLQPDAAKVLEAMCRSEYPAYREEAAGVLAALERDRALPLLSKLLEDPDERVLAKAIECAGMLALRDHLTRLFKLLEHPRLRDQAERALAQYGERILGVLEDYLKDATVASSIRYSVPSVLRRIPVRKSAAILVAGLEAPEVKLRFKCLKTLNRLRRERKDIPLEPDGIRQAILFECDWFQHLHADRIGLAFVSSTEPAAVLLAGHTQDHLGWTIERIFRLLGLLYKQQDIHRAYLGYISASAKLRGHAVEYLDNILDGGLRRAVMPVLEKDSEHGHREADMRPEISSQKVLLDILERPDPVAQALSIKIIASHFPEAARQLSRFRDNPDFLIQEVLRDFSH